MVLQQHEGNFSCRQVTSLQTQPNRLDITAEKGGVSGCSKVATCTELPAKVSLVTEPELHLHFSCAKGLATTNSPRFSLPAG